MSFINKNNLTDESKLNILWEYLREKIDFICLNEDGEGKPCVQVLINDGGETIRNGEVFLRGTTISMQVDQVKEKA